MTRPDSSTTASAAVFARFLDVERQARAAATSDELAYCIVNDSQPLFGFRHASLIINGRVRAVTGVTQPAPHAPFVAFIERACTQLQAADKDRFQQCSVIEATLLDEQSRRDWQTLSAPEALWSPLTDRKGNTFGAIWYAREQPWQNADRVLAEQLGGAFSHAWLALAPQTSRWRKHRAGWKIAVPLLLVVACLFIPVRQSVLAPAEVVPHQGRVVAAPLDGVIQSFVVQPNQRVHQGDVLVRFDDTTLKAQADVAEQALNVAEAEYRASSQRAFQDVDSKARLDFLSAQVAQKRAERDYATALLNRAEIRADREGIAVFADADRWTGKPVRTGERLMELADPMLAALRIELDVGDAIQLQQILAAANQEPGLPLRVKELEQLLQFLRQHDLVSAGDAEQRQRYLGKARALHTSLWKKILHQYLFFRIPLWRPDPMLNRSWPWLQRYGPLFLIGVFPLLVALGLFLVSRDWVRYTHAFPHLFSLPGMAVFGLSLVFAKFIHELGHAFMAKRAGCRVQSMGVAFIVLFPLFYTDVSDAWKLKDRRSRLLIGAGGILAEMLLAGIALLVWALLPDGPMRTAAFMLSSATWVTTLAVNLNPLMRFDGYFLLSDLWRVENLQERAYALCRWRLRESLFGYGHPPPETWSPNLQRKLLIWGYASWIWRFFLFFGIALVVYHFFIKVIGIGLMLIEIAWFIALPILKEAYIWWSMRSSIQPASLLRTILFFLFVLFILLYPWRGSVHIPAVLEAANVSTLYSPLPAQVKRLYVTDGQQVNAGDILLELGSSDLDYRLEIERQRIALLQQQLRRGAARQETASETQVFDQQLAESLARYRGLAAQQQRLVLRAPQAGVVRDIARDTTPDRWVTADTPLLLRIIDPRQGRVMGYIPEDRLTRTQPEMEGVFLAEDPAFPRQVVRLQTIAPTGSAYLQQEMLASDRHGPIAVRRDSQQYPQPVQAHYSVRFSLVSETPLPQQPLRGSVILQGEKESLLGAIWRRVAALGIRESGF